MMLLSRGLDISSTDIAPTACYWQHIAPTAKYWQHPEEKEDIGNFIYEVCIVRVFVCVYVNESPHYFCKFNILVCPETTKKV